MFTHLHTHSNYSFLEGADRMEDLCRAARKRGMNALALTDTHGLYGAVRFQQIAQAMGMEPILGAEIKTQTAQAVLLAKNGTGYTNLCRALSARHLEEDFSLEGSLNKSREGLIVLSRSLPLLEALGKEGGTEDLYLELTAEVSRRDFLKLTHNSGIRPVATQDVHFVHPDGFGRHRLLRAIALNTTLSRIPKEELADPKAWLKSPEEMAALFPNCPEALENTSQIAEACRFRLNLNTLIFPDLEVSSKGKSFDTLRQLAYQGAQKRCGALSDRVRSRLEYELKIICDMGFSDYFLVVHDIVGQSIRTCGRGSAAASLVAYALGITHVDPIRHDLFFERFLNMGRKDPPDIDVDFAWDERDQILAYVFKKYGNSRSAMVSNHVCFKTRSALREIAKVYGLPDDEISSVTQKRSRMWFQADSSEGPRHPMFHKADFPDPWPEIIRLAQELQGFPRNLSVHCGGVVVVPDGLDHYVPRQMSAKGVQIIQWEKDQAEEAGLVKIDLLGNRSLAVIREALKAIDENYGVKIAYDTWNPIDDPDTQELIKKGDTMGVFYVESPAMRQLQKKAQMGDFDHLVIHSSIIRPAANEFIRQYLIRLKGEPYQPLHPLLADILKDTYGIMVYQEDVSKTAIALAGFSPAEADELRKILSKKHNEKRLADIEAQFVQGAQKNQIPKETIDAIWRMILSFQGYSFCKPHSASYAMVSYKSAYLRAHFPAEFMAAVISNQGGYYSTFAYISEARRMGLEVLLPDINESQRQYTGKNKKLRVGLMQLTGLESGLIESLLEARGKGMFCSFDDFLCRVKGDPAQVKILIKAGAFDRIEPKRTRPELIWQLVFWNAAKKNGKTKALSLFDTHPGPAPQRAPDYDLETILRQEQEVLGFLISWHPLDLYRDQLRKCS
ncbi:MAG: DNA polymerase III subunit alpha, partial [Candidatus Latescibacterota bacterium]